MTIIKQAPLPSFFFENESTGSREAKVERQIQLCLKEGWTCQDRRLNHPTDKDVYMTFIEKTAEWVYSPKLSRILSANSIDLGSTKN